MKISKAVSKFYMSDFKDEKLKLLVKGFQTKTNEKYNHTYYGIPCKLIGSHKVWRRIQFKDGSTTIIEYNELK